MKYLGHLIADEPLSDVEFLQVALRGALPLPFDAAEILQYRGQPDGRTVLTDAEGTILLCRLGSAEHDPAGQGQIVQM